MAQTAILISFEMRHSRLQSLDLIAILCYVSTGFPLVPSSRSYLAISFIFRSLSRCVRKKKYKAIHQSTYDLYTTNNSTSLKFLRHTSILERFTPCFWYRYENPNFTLAFIHVEISLWLFAIRMGFQKSKWIEVWNDNDTTRQDATWYLRNSLKYFSFGGLKKYL